MTLPVPSGPASAVARLVLTAAATAASGSLIRVQARVEISSDAPRIITTSAGSRLLITRDGQVVGGAGSDGDGAVPLPLRAGTSRPVQVLPEAIRLVDDVERSRLQPGDYAIVGVMAYGGDPLDNAPGGATGRAFVLVSAPVPITVR